MKKAIYLIAFIFSLGALQAQTYLGPKVGLNLSTHGLSDALDDAYETSIRLGFSFGAAAELSLGGRMGLQIEGLFVQKGAKYEEFDPYLISDGNGNQEMAYLEFTEKLNYLEFPVLLKYNLRGKEVGGYFIAGPSFGFGMSGTGSGSYKGETQDFPFDDFDINFGSGRNDQYTSFDFSLAFGGGAFFELYTGKIVADVRFNLGLSNISNADSSQNSIKNRSIMISFGYLYPLGGAW